MDTTTTTIDTPTEATPSDFKRSAKAIHNAAMTHGWTLESATIGRGQLTSTYVMDDTDVYLPVEQNHGDGYQGRPRWLTPERATFMFDPDTGAYWGGRVEDRMWGDDDYARATHYDRPSDAEAAMTCPQRELDRINQAKADEAQREADQAHRAEVREAYIGTLVDDWDWRRLNSDADAVPSSPEVDSRYGLADARRKFDAYVEARAYQELCDQARRMVGRPNADDVPMPINVAVERVVLNNQASYDNNGVEDIVAKACRSLVSRFGGGAW